MGSTPTLQTNTYCRLLILHRGELLAHYWSTSVSKVIAAAGLEIHIFFMLPGSSWPAFSDQLWIKHWCIQMCLFLLVPVSGVSFLAVRLHPVVGQDHAASCVSADWVLRDRWDSDRLFPWRVWQSGWHSGKCSKSRLPKHEAPACVTVQTESADCRWYAGDRCRLALLSCSSGWCRFLQGKKTFELRAKSRIHESFCLCYSLRFRYWNTAVTRTLNRTFLVFGSLWSKDEFVYHSEAFW